MRSSSSTSGYARGGGRGSSHRPSRPQDHHHHHQQQQDHYTDSEEPTEDPLLLNDPSFDILEWHPAFQSCQRYFLDHAQHEPATQAVCALINIRLPFQDLENPILSSTQSFPSSSQNQHFYYQRSSPNSPGAGPSGGNLSPYAQHTGHQSPNHPRPAGPGSSSSSAKSAQPKPPDPHNPQLSPPPPPFISLLPYIRRLIVTNFDNPAILHGFFGDSWRAGILPHVQCERRNYLFAAKHGGWRSCKKQYDAGSGFGREGSEVVPFLKPLGGVGKEELRGAEEAWGEWLGMEDWMVGEEDGDGGGGEGRR